MYLAIVLDEESKNKLINQFKDIIPDNWKIFCHHMTINLKGYIPNEEYQLGQEEIITATHLGMNEKVIAVKVLSNIKSVNVVKHVTIATAPESKPKDSKEIQTWHTIKPIILKGKILVQD